MDRLKLMAILAHPDDESLGIGGTLVKYASEGVDTYLVTATRGERGRFGRAEVSPGLEVVGETRTRELLAAAKILKLSDVSFLNYIDGDLDQANPEIIVPQISRLIREVRPEVVITFGMDGAYGHPDHIAISQFTSAAIIHAAHHGEEDTPAHPVSKLYWMYHTKAHWDAYQSAFKKLSSTVDGIERIAYPVPDWMITTKLDATEYWEEVYRAVRCHETQVAVYEKLDNLTAAQHRVIWGIQTFYRVMSLVNGGRELEDDLFAGLR